MIDTFCEISSIASRGGALSHIKCCQSRFAEVNSPTTSLTYPLAQRRRGPARRLLEALSEPCVNTPYNVRLSLYLSISLYRAHTFSLAHSHTRTQLLRRNVKQFRGGLVFKAHRRVYHSTLGSSILEKVKNSRALFRRGGAGQRDGSSRQPFQPSATQRACLLRCDSLTLPNTRPES